ncbi:MAG TPA: DUF1415 domain-containing protein [Leucothrix mucor]|uniref:DUF1415 domain-containing protein n=1 Tax=Leucothrix mucor TaxID=45248 RepID=A0A7V2WUQ7_LEUMU|nr:DUF1415 domain-containing protein [Leucothrix mucor]
MIAKQTKNWLEKIVIKHDFCPFAQRELLRDSIRYSINEASNTEDTLHHLVDEFIFLDRHPETETTLFIIPEGFNDFDDFLDLVEIANALLEEQHYSGIYQLANFHPDYCFHGSDEDDPANYTNRSPYPILHLIREKSLERAVASHSDPESIPERNIAYARELGVHKLKSELYAIKQNRE